MPPKKTSKKKTSSKKTKTAKHKSGNKMTVPSVKENKTPQITAASIAAKKKITNARKATAARADSLIKKSAMPIVSAPKPKPSESLVSVELSPPPKPSKKERKETPSPVKKASQVPKITKQTAVAPPPDLTKPKMLPKEKFFEPRHRPILQPLGKGHYSPKSGDKKKSGPPAKKEEEPSDGSETVKQEKKKILYNEMMTVKDLAEAMDKKVADVIKTLMGMGNLTTINQRLATETAQLLADELGYELDVKSIYEDEEIVETDPEAHLKPRSPVVTVMGHVDHGKTSLLDAIRSARVAEHEHGGITQHIGAYQVSTDKGNITFLDTPGHEAFTAMRARGADVTDLIVLVVAADDSVMPQTVEAIDHAKAAEVPIVVAINKMDLPAANVQRVKQELSQHNILSEDWGGKVQMAEVSAKAKKNIDSILNMILLESELLELKANPDRPARGTVLEARLDPKKGVTATILIKTGTLHVSDVVVCGLSSGRIRAMLDHSRHQLREAGPAVPVEILGLTEVPHVGDQLSVVKSDREARGIAERRKQHVKDTANKPSSHVSLENLHTQIEAGQVQNLNVILKADVQGSLQAIHDALGKISSKFIQLRFVHSGVGTINDSDILLAETADALVFGFNVKVENSAEIEAKKAGVDIRLYSIIYEIIADVKAALEGKLKPVEVEKVIGRALVKSVFSSSRHGKIAGCQIQEGKMTRGHKARLVRDGDVVATGAVTSLKRFKEDVREVDKGYECGLALEGVRAFEPNDIIEVFIIEKQARRLEHE